MTSAKLRGVIRIAIDGENADKWIRDDNQLVDAVVGAVRGYLATIENERVAAMKHYGRPAPLEVRLNSLRAADAAAGLRDDKEHHPMNRFDRD